LQLALKMATPKTVAELEALKAADLITMRTDLLKQFETVAPEKKSAETDKSSEPKGFFTKK